MEEYKIGDILENNEIKLDDLINPEIKKHETVFDEIINYDDSNFYNIKNRYNVKYEEV